MTEKELQQYLVRSYPKENERHEWKEMKNLKNSFAGDEGSDVISYVSALANMEGGELVIGVRNQTLEIVGTDLSNLTFNGVVATPESAKFKLTEKCMNLSSEGLIVEEFVTSDTQKTVWVIHIPRHKPRLPVYAHSKAWQRVGDSLIELREERRQSILSEPLGMFDDWSASVIENATLEDLDPEAIALARKGFKEKFPQFSNDMDQWPDATFLDRANLTQEGKVTRTAMLLVGKKEKAYKLGHIAQIVWKCYQDGEIFGDTFTIPFIISTSELLGRIRNYRFKIYPNNSLLPAEVWKYDTRSILEGMHNCILHQDYTYNERILVIEDKDKLTFENAGGFYDGRYEEYVTGQKTPKRYRNTFLAKGMDNVKMVDSKGYGIHKLFERQKERYLPMPDYEGSDGSHVVMHLPGTVIDPNYSLMLMQNNDIDLTEAVLLDLVQKQKPIPDNAIAMLRKKKLLEGHKPNVYVAKKVAQKTDRKVEYSKHKGLEDKSCESLLKASLKDHDKLTRAEIDKLLWDVLSDQLSAAQKKTKIGYILRKLHAAGNIKNETRGNKSFWSLVK